MRGSRWSLERPTVQWRRHREAKRQQGQQGQRQGRHRERAWQRYQSRSSGLTSLLIIASSSRRRRAWWVVVMLSPGSPNTRRRYSSVVAGITAFMVRSMVRRVFRWGMSSWSTPTGAAINIIRRWARWRMAVLWSHGGMTAVTAGDRVTMFGVNATMALVLQWEKSFV